MANEAGKENYREILRHLVCGCEKMLMYPEFFNGLWFTYTSFARAKIIVKIDGQNLEKIPQFVWNLNAWTILDIETRRIIDELSCQIIK